MKFLYPLPIKGTITQTFNQHTWGNKGLDIAAPTNTMLLASFRSKVVREGYDEDGYGYYIRMRSTDEPKYELLYAHMISPSPLSVGDVVEAGQEVGRMDSTGRSTGSHVHFEIIENGVRVDPLKYLEEITPEPHIDVPFVVPEFPQLPIAKVISDVGIRVRQSPWGIVISQVSYNELVKVQGITKTDDGIVWGIIGHKQFIALQVDGDALVEWVS